MAIKNTVSRDFDLCSLIFRSVLDYGLRGVITLQGGCWRVYQWSSIN